MPKILFKSHNSNVILVNGNWNGDVLPLHTTYGIQLKLWTLKIQKKPCNNRAMVCNSILTNDELCPRYRTILLVLFFRSLFRSLPWPRLVNSSSGNQSCFISLTSHFKRTHFPYYKFVFGFFNLSRKNDGFELCWSKSINMPNFWIFWLS